LPATREKKKEGGGGEEASKARCFLYKSSPRHCRRTASVSSLGREKQEEGKEEGGKRKEKSSIIHSIIWTTNSRTSHL